LQEELQRAWTEWGFEQAKLDRLQKKLLLPDKKSGTSRLLVRHFNKRELNDGRSPLTQGLTSCLSLHMAGASDSTSLNHYYTRVLAHPILRPSLPHA
jgi:hypothetical protein